MVIPDDDLNFDEDENDDDDDDDDDDEFDLILILTLMIVWGMETHTNTRCHNAQCGAYICNLLDWTNMSMKHIGCDISKL